MDVVNCELDKWWCFLYFHCQIQLWKPHTHTHALPPSLLTLTILTWNLAIKFTQLLNSGNWRTPSQTGLVLDLLPSAKPPLKFLSGSPLTGFAYSNLSLILPKILSFSISPSHPAFRSNIKPYIFHQQLKHSPHSLITVRV